jgi:hypothetical protein
LEGLAGRGRVAASSRLCVPNGYVVRVLQAAWSAILSIPVPEDNPSRHFGRALYAAVRAGDDTDTVAAIGGHCSEDAGAYQASTRYGAMRCTAGPPCASRTWSRCATRLSTCAAWARP